MMVGSTICLDFKHSCSGHLESEICMDCWWSCVCTFWLE